MRSNHLASVIIPAYNHEKYIQEAIYSIINQTYKNIELLIINDGSSDSTYDKICEMEIICKKRFARFDFADQKNKGVIETLNRLIGMASGEYVFLIASDDIAAPHAVETEVVFLSDHPDYALCVGNNDIIDENSRICFWDKNRNNVYDAVKADYVSLPDALAKECPEVNFLSEAFGLYSNLVLYGNHVPNGYCIRKSIFEKTGLYTKEAPLEDYWMMMQIAKHAKMKYLIDTLFYYRWHSNNTLKKFPGLYFTYKTVLYELLNAYPEVYYFKRCGEEMEEWKKKLEMRNKKIEMTPEESEYKMKNIKEAFLGIMIKGNTSA
jgi:alpha-1,3-rhamnosyltransferase